MGYDPTTSTLGIRFHSGSEYHYFDVPEELYNGLVSAPSVGRYFHEHVKKTGYAYRKVR